jgi:hypothetical protein
MVVCRALSQRDQIAAGARACKLCTCALLEVVAGITSTTMVWLLALLKRNQDAILADAAVRCTRVLCSEVVACIAAPTMVFLFAPVLRLQLAVGTFATIRFASTGLQVVATRARAAVVVLHTLVLVRHEGTVGARAREGIAIVGGVDVVAIRTPDAMVMLHSLVLPHKLAVSAKAPVREARGDVIHATDVVAGVAFPAMAMVCSLGLLHQHSMCTTASVRNTIPVAQEVPTVAASAVVILPAVCLLLHKVAVAACAGPRNARSPAVQVVATVALAAMIFSGSQVRCGEHAIETCPGVLHTLPLRAKAEPRVAVAAMIILRPFLLRNELAVGTASAPRDACTGRQPITAVARAAVRILPPAGRIDKRAMGTTAAPRHTLPRRGGLEGGQTLAAMVFLEPEALLNQAAVVALATPRLALAR